MNLESILQKYPSQRRENLIPILQDIQDEIGYLSEDSVKKISKYLNLPSSKIYGVATFFAQFRFANKGKFHIQLCNGTTCHLQSNGALIKDVKNLLQIEDGETSKDGNFSLEILTCIGACGHSPVMAVNGKYYSEVDKEQLKDIINRLKEEAN